MKKQFELAHNTPSLDPLDLTPRQVTYYFKNLGIRFRKEFKALKQAEFRASGNKAKREGWFLGYRGIVEVALAEKIADLVHLSGEEKKSLAQAALLNGAMRRIQYERRGSAVSTEERDSIDEEASPILVASGVDQGVVNIRRGVYAGFAKTILQDSFGTKDEHKTKSLKLQKYLFYIHNCTNQKVSKTSQETNIIDWRAHLKEAEEKYKNIASEKILVKGVEMSRFAGEIMLMEQIENELREKIEASKPASLQKTEPVWRFLRTRIEQDIARGS